MIQSIHTKKKHRCNGDLALHVLNIIDSIKKSAVTGKREKIVFNCKKPNFFNKKEIKNILR